MSFLQKSEDPETELEVPIKKLTVQPLKVADGRLSPRSTSFFCFAVMDILVGAAELDGGVTEKLMLHCGPWAVLVVKYVGKGLTLCI